jgi:hypothetical protein
VPTALLLLLAASAIRDVSVPSNTADPVYVSCPQGRVTRIVWPEALVRLKSEGQNARFDLALEQTRPQGVIAVTPHAFPSRTILNARGAMHTLRIVVESAPSGAPTDVRLSFTSAEGPPAVAPTAGPSIVVTAPPPLATSMPETVAAPAPEAAGLAAVELLRARVVVAGDRESLPGQPAMILTDVLQGERWVWLRFRLEAGAAARISRVSWEGGEIADVTQEPQDRDLRVVVRLERAALTRRAHVSLEVEGGATYTFGLDSRPLRELFK